MNKFTIGVQTRLPIPAISPGCFRCSALICRVDVRYSERGARGRAAEQSKRHSSLFDAFILADAAIYLRSHDEDWVSTVTLP
jgi:hypothetical protein